MPDTPSHVLEVVLRGPRKELEMLREALRMQAKAFGYQLDAVLLTTAAVYDREDTDETPEPAMAGALS